MEKIQNQLLGTPIAETWRKFQQENVYHNISKLFYHRFGFACIYLFVFMFIMAIKQNLLFEWSLLLVYLLHQFEEHAFPGGFGTFINAKFGQNISAFTPISPGFIFWTNCIFIWFIFLYELPVPESSSHPISNWPKIDPKIPFLTIGICLINALTHVMAALVLKTYNPGLLTAIFLLIPFSIYAMIKYQILQDQQKIHQLLIGLGWAILLHILLIVSFIGIIKFRRR